MLSDLISNLRAAFGRRAAHAEPGPAPIEAPEPRRPTIGEHEGPMLAICASMLEAERMMSIRGKRGEGTKIWRAGPHRGLLMDPLLLHDSSREHMAAAVDNLTKTLASGLAHGFGNDFFVDTASNFIRYEALHAFDTIEHAGGARHLRMAELLARCDDAGWHQRLPELAARQDVEEARGATRLIALAPETAASVRQSAHELLAPLRNP